MKLLIIGGGNLGLDLGGELHKRNLDWRIIAAKEPGDYYPGFQPDIMIYTPGGGITEPWPTVHKKNFTDFYYYCEKYRAEKTFFFSSNAALQPQLSPYAFAKLAMEKIVWDDKQDSLYAIRINSIYGTHKPEKCFPNKLIERSKPWLDDWNFQLAKPLLSLPTNPIAPTPTKWLAEKVIDYILAGDYKKVISIAPRGETTPLEWGKLILGGKYECKGAGMANDRPTTSFVSDVDYPETWLDLWKKYGPAQIGKSLGE